MQHMAPAHVPFAWVFLMVDLMCADMVPGGAAARPSKTHNYGKGELVIIEQPDGAYNGGATDLRLPIPNITLPDRPTPLRFPTSVNFTLPDRPPVIPIPKPDEDND